MWNFLTTMIGQIPWLAIACVGAWGLYRGAKTLPLILQVLGALGLSATVIAHPIIINILLWMDAPNDLLKAAGIIMTFLTFVMLCVFATGFIMEKLKKNKVVPLG